MRLMTLRASIAVVDGRVSRDLAGHHNEAGGAQRFGGDAPMFVLGEHGVEHGVGNLVGDLVGMAFGNRFRGEQEIAHWMVS